MVWCVVFTQAPAPILKGEGRHEVVEEEKAGQDGIPLMRPCLTTTVAGQTIRRGHGIVADATWDRSIEEPASTKIEHACRAAAGAVTGSTRPY